MNGDRGETYLRLAAEAELRRAGARSADSAAQAGHTARMARIAQALTAVHALRDEVADQILGDFELALAVRRAGSRDRPGPGSLLRPPGVRLRLGRPLRSAPPRPVPVMVSRPSAAGWPARSGPRGSAGPARAPRAGPGSGRVVRLGQAIPVSGENVRGELYLLSYAQTSSGPQFSLFARPVGPATSPGPPGSPGPGRITPAAARPGMPPIQPWPGVSRLEQITATDDRGTSYRMTVRDLGGGPDGWTLMLHPDPPYDPRWLDLTTTLGESPVRVDLSSPEEATVTVSAATLSPGEHLLHTIATRLLAAPPVGPPDADLAAPRPGPATGVTDGDVIAALQAVGALSRFSRVPGQLAALYSSLRAGGPGITAPPARDLPEPWLSVLAHYRGKTRAAPARDGCAAAAVAFPAVDGIRLAILGLHNRLGGTVLHMHASGPRCHVSYQPNELYLWPTIWIRDSDGNWHVTLTRGRSEMKGEVAMRMEVVPPLSHATAWIEVVATGESAEARTRLPLSWE